MKKLVKHKLDTRKDLDIKTRKKIMKRIEQLRKKEKNDYARRIKMLKSKVKKLIKFIKPVEKKPSTNLSNEVIEEI